MEINILTSLLYIAWPFLAAGVLIETFIFWMFTGKTGVSFWKSLLGVFIANFATVVLTFFISFYSDNDINLIWFIVAFSVAVLIEWLIFIMFFQKNKINSFKLLLISLIGNTVTYVVIGFLIFYKNGLIDKYLARFSEIEFQIPAL